MEVNYTTMLEPLKVAEGDSYGVYWELPPAQCPPHPCLGTKLHAHPRLWLAPAPPSLPCPCQCAWPASDHSPLPEHPLLFPSIPWVVFMGFLRVFPKCHPKTFSPSCTGLDMPSLPSLLKPRLARPPFLRDNYFGAKTFTEVLLFSNLKWFPSSPHFQPHSQRLSSLF